MSGSFAWVCICILDGGHFSFPDADEDPGSTGLALTDITLLISIVALCGIENVFRIFSIASLNVWNIKEYFVEYY